MKSKASDILSVQKVYTEWREEKDKNQMYFTLNAGCETERKKKLYRSTFLLLSPLLFLSSLSLSLSWFLWFLSFYCFCCPHFLLHHSLHLILVHGLQTLMEQNTDCSILCFFFILFFHKTLHKNEPTWKECNQFSSLSSLFLLSFLYILVFVMSDTFSSCSWSAEKALLKGLPSVTLYALQLRGTEGNRKNDTKLRKTRKSSSKFIFMKILILLQHLFSIAFCSIYLLPLLVMHSESLVG